MNVYMVGGAENLQAMFKPGAMSGKAFMMRITQNITGALESDMDKFINDNTGILPKPAPGTEDTPANERYNYAAHQINHVYLGRTHHVNSLAESFYRFFSERLALQPLGEWTTVQLFHFFKTDVTESATRSLNGTRLLEINPDFTQNFWDFDDVALQLAWGLPKWLNPRPWRVRERYHSMFKKSLKSARERLDWDGPAADADWEENLGSRYAREAVKWTTENGFSEQQAAGSLGTGTFGYAPGPAYRP